MAEEIRPLPPPTRAQNRAALVIIVLFISLVVAGGWYLRKTSRGGGGSTAGAMQGKGAKGELSPVQINDVTVRFKGQFRMPRSEVQMEFRNPQGELVDVGQVKLALNMNMPGMVMHDDVTVTGGGGRYTAQVKPQMAGDWMAKLSYVGPKGSGEKT